jgi:hypothetical protein
MKLLLLLVFVAASTWPLSAQTKIFGSADTTRIEQLESEVAALKQGSRWRWDLGGVSFLFGAFCALWAQNSGRRPWLWFFLGFLFTFITVIVLLVKNSNDRVRRRRSEAAARFHPPGSAPVTLP